MTNKIKKIQMYFFKNLKNNLKKNKEVPINPKIMPHKNGVFPTKTKPEPGST
jgi:hypothetical protein